MIIISEPISTKKQTKYSTLIEHHLFYYKVCYYWLWEAANNLFKWYLQKMYVCMKFHAFFNEEPINVWLGIAAKSQIMSLQWVTIKKRCQVHHIFCTCFHKSGYSKFFNDFLLLRTKIPNLEYIQKVLSGLVPVSLRLQLYIVLFFFLVSSWFLPWPDLQLLKCTSFHLRVFTYRSQISFPLPVTTSSSLCPPSSTFLFSPNSAFNFSQRWWFW